MKEWLLTTPLATSVLGLREWFTLKSLPTVNPEKAALVANGIIADRLIARICTPGGTFLDIGAHLGSILAAVRRHSDDVQLVAVEADAGKFASLKRRFPDCRFLQCAVGETAGKSIFYTFPNRSGFNSLTPSDAHGAVETTVEVRTLDDLFPDLTVDTIKIDIEGAELGALRGGKEMIARSRPTIMFESAGTERNALGYTPGDLHAWFTANGFEIFLPDRLAHNSPPMDAPTFLDAHFYPMRSVNFFAVPTERRIEIRDKARRILRIMPVKLDTRLP